ncbi:hypothetical protein GCM10022377_26490 [Zhihengliuella alba]|uniref:Tail fiber protein n=1 Tax=Zhihengliuella alba TaxID=547018 RepID=A0ABP7E3H3_9MICC
MPRARAMTPRTAATLLTIGTAERQMATIATTSAAMPRPRPARVLGAAPVGPVGADGADGGWTVCSGKLISPPKVGDMFGSGVPGPEPEH